MHVTGHHVPWDEPELRPTNKYYQSIYEFTAHKRTHNISDGIRRRCVFLKGEYWICPRLPSVCGTVLSSFCDNNNNRIIVRRREKFSTRSQTQQQGASELLMHFLSNNSLTKWFSSMSQNQRNDISFDSISLRPKTKKILAKNRCCR